VTARLWLVLAVAAGGALLVAGIYVMGRSDGRALGERAIIKQIEKDNADAGNKAEDFRSAFRRCLDGGGLFDFETGSCER